MDNFLEQLLYDKDANITAVTRIIQVVIRIVDGFSLTRKDDGTSVITVDCTRN